MKAKYTYNDIVHVKIAAPNVARPGAKAWIVALHDASEGGYFDQFPSGIVYTVEFEDGESTEVHESFLDFDPN